MYNPRCECGVFAHENKPGVRDDIQIAYIGDEAAAGDCDQDGVGDTECYQYVYTTNIICQDFMSNKFQCHIHIVVLF